MTQDNTGRNALIIGASFLVSLFIINAIVGPLYGVWARGLAGKAQLQEAEYTRQVAVLEAQAKKDSAQQLADAEVIRAEGVARANQVIAGSLKDNKEYLQYLYIQNLEQGSEKGNKLIMVPIGLDGTPVPTFSVDK